jgi:hypothetical protein
MQAFLATTGRQSDFLTLETHALRLPAYHDYLRRKYPAQWNAHKIEPNLPDLYDEDQMVQTLVEIAAGTDIFYLHPSFGLIFEYFSDEPHCLTQRLRLYPPHSLLAEPLSDQLVTENEAFWSGMENRRIKPLVPDVNEVTTLGRPGNRQAFS